MVDDGDRVLAAARREERSQRCQNELDEPDLWERHAGWWQQGFSQGADPEYEEQILPLAAHHLAGARRVLDVGCGEGQVARLVANGAGTAGVARVVGIDASAAQVTEADRRAGGPAYARARAERLPFPTGSFDAVVACLVLEHTSGLDAAVAEVARVLAMGGRFVMFVNHPLFQTPGSGWIDDQVLDPPEQYWRVGPYLEETVTREEVDAGVVLPFAHRPLSRYINALGGHGLLIAHMDEPSPPPGFMARAPEYGGAAYIPRLAVIVARRA